MKDTVPLTRRGAEQLRESLHRFIQRRDLVTAAIEKARGYGDLKENTDYHAAKEEQALVAWHIADIESKLARGTIIDPKQLKKDGKVVFGVTVHLMNMSSQEITIYQIVGEDEADVRASKISIYSPIARALIGKKNGDIVDVQTLSGLQAFKINQIEYI